LSSTDEAPGNGAAGDPSAADVSPRVFISYARDNPEHVERVRGFWQFLRDNRIDAKLDLAGAEERRLLPRVDGAGGRASGAEG
jgi:hypothetical protein